LNYLLDTNVVIIYSKSRDLAQKIEAEHRLFVAENNLAVSIVTIAEIRSIIHQFNIGDKRRAGIDKILEHVTQLGIDYDLILDRYEEIDAFSQGRHRTLRSDFQPVNMGKNDLWIAATASAFGITLVTTDKDFNHLAGNFLELKFIDLNHYR
jgi:tRNA(fMet)-specific endonuclease VapC